MKNKTHWASQNERGYRFFLFCTMLIVRYFPLPIIRLCCAVVCAYYYLISPTQRRHIKAYHKYLINTFPQSKIPKLAAVYRQFMTFGEAITDRFAVWQNKIVYEDLVIDDPDNVYQVIDTPNQKGQLLICSHLGNIEICRALLHRGHHGDFKLNVLVHNQHAKKFNQALKKSGAKDLNMIQVSELDMSTMLELANRLERGEWIAIAADRIPVRGEKTIAINFLGHTALFPQGPWLLALLLKAKINTIFAIKQQGKYVLKLRQFQENTEIAHHQRQQTIRENAQRFADKLAEQAAQTPLQWFNFYDFWNTDA